MNSLEKTKYKVLLNSGKELEVQSHFMNVGKRGLTEFFDFENQAEKMFLMVPTQNIESITETLPEIPTP